MKSRISSGVDRDENGEKVGAGFAGQRVDPGVSVTQSAIIIAQRPFVESPKAKGLSEREGRFRGRGMGRFESANGVLGCKPRTSIHHQTNSRLPIRARISYELSQ